MCCLLFSGVFQSLVEKHFPAPDRRKMFDLLTMSGSGSSSSRLFDSSPVPSPGAVASVKRKLDSSGTSFCIDDSETDCDNDDDNNDDEINRAVSLFLQYHHHHQRISSRRKSERKLQGR